MLPPAFVFPKFFLHLVLAFFVLVIMTTSHAQMPDDSQLLLDYQAFAAYHQQLQDTLAEITKKTASNEVIDWLSIAEKLGIPPTSGDDVLARINAMLNLSSDVITDVNNTLAKNGKSLEQCLQAGNICNDENITDLRAFLLAAVQLTGSDSPQGKINAIKNKPGNYSADPDLADVTGPQDNFFDVGYMLSSLSKQIPVLIRFVKALSWVCGIYLVMMGVLKLRAYGENRSINSSSQGTLGTSITYVFVGTALIYFPSMFYVVSDTLFGVGGGDSVLSYDPEVLHGFAFAGLAAVVIAIVRLVGYIAFFRGWLIIVKLGSPNAQHGILSKAIIHIIGGILAINILSTWEVLRATFGYAW